MQAASIPANEEPALEQLESFAIAFPIGGKWVRLPSEAKWIRAIKAADLARSTTVAVEENGLTTRTCPASDVPELAALFDLLIPLPRSPEPASDPETVATQLPTPPSPVGSEAKPSAPRLPDDLQIWPRVMGVKPPAPDLPLPSAVAWKPRDKKMARRALERDVRRWSLAALAGILWHRSLSMTADEWVLLAIAAGIAAAVVWPWRTGAKAAKIRATYQSRKSDWEKLLAAWLDVATTKRFDAKRAELEGVRQRHDALLERRTRMLAELDTREYQMSRHLGAIPLANARIHGIGAGRLSALRAHGIITAADVSQRIQYLPGFGEAMTSRLLSWRAQCAARLNHDPKLSSRPAEIRRVDQSIAATKRELLEKLESGPPELSAITQEIEAARERMAGSIAHAWDQYQSAKLAWRAA